MRSDAPAVPADPHPIRAAGPDRTAVLRRWRDGVLTAAAFGLVLAFVFGSIGGGQTALSDPAGTSRLAEVSLPR